MARLFITSRQRIFQIGVAPRRIDLITDIGGVTFDEVKENRVVVELDGLIIPVISKEKLIKNKEATGWKKDLLDVETLKNLEN